MEVNKNDGTTSEQQTKGILILPAKFKPKHNENTASKQQKINKFFKQQENVENNKKQQHETNTNKQQITEINKKPTKNPTTKTRSKKIQQQEKTTRQYRGYWANLALRQKQQKEEQETTKQEIKTTETELHNNVDASIGTKSEQNSNFEALSNGQILSLEASPNHEKSYYDVTGDKVLEHSLILESNQIRSIQIKKGKQITEKYLT